MSFRSVIIYMALVSLISCGGGGSSNNVEKQYNSEEEKRIVQLMDAAVVEFGNTKKYTYPILPGMPEWGEAQTLGINVTHIPEDLLAQMSNSELLQVISESPEITNRYAYDDYLFFLRNFIKRTNALEYLLAKPNVNEFLVNEYISLPNTELEISVEDSFGRGSLGVKIFLIELLLAHEERYLDFSHSPNFLNTLYKKLNYELNLAEDIIAIQHENWVSSSYVIIPILKDEGYLLSHFENGDEAKRTQLVLPEETIQEILDGREEATTRDLYLWLNAKFKEYLEDTAVFQVER